MLLTVVSGTWHQPAIPRRDGREEISIEARPDSSPSDGPEKAGAESRASDHQFLLDLTTETGQVDQSDIGIHGQITAATPKLWQAQLMLHEWHRFFSKESHMIIQSGYGALAYNGIATSFMHRQDGKMASATIADPAKNADQVTLSGAGKALAADESNTTHSRTPAQEKLIMAASSDRESADKIAQGMAYTPSTIFYDISGVGGGEEVRKLSTSGRIIDDEFKSKFNSEASVIDAQRRAIYDTEKAKGTDPLQILSKMIDFTNSQSRDYLEASGWGYQGSTPPG